MEKIDKTKENIRVSELDQQTRKKLFNNFVDAGGEVIKERKKTALSDFDREKQLKYKSQIERHNKKLKNKTLSQDRREGKKKIAARVEYSPAGLPKLGSIRLYFQKLQIRLRLFFLGVTDIYAYYLNNKFLNRFDHEYKTSLLEIQILFLDMFQQNEATGKKIIAQLDAIQPLYFELIEMVSNIFDGTAINELLEHHYNFPDIQQKSSEIKDSIIKIFKKIYVLNTYVDIILYAYERAIDMQMKLEDKKSSFYSARKKTIRNSLYIIFNKLYPRLYWLICHYEGRIIFGKALEDVIGITNADMPGIRKKADAIKMVEIPVIEKETEDQEEKSEKNKLSIPSEVKNGLQLMYKLDLNKLKELYDKNNLFKHMEDSDKISIIYMLFMEFEIEYSFILTTNKIKYNIISTQSGRQDYKQKLSDHFNELIKCSERLKDYVDKINTYEDTRTKKPENNTHYIEFSKKLTSLEKEKKMIGTDARGRINLFFEKLCVDLKTLAEDVKNEASIIINPQDELEFDEAIEGKKKLNGKKIYEAITTSYNYAAAFLYRLSSKGDLAGSLVFKESDKELSTQIKENAERQDEASQDNSLIDMGTDILTKNEKAKESKSIIDELDDMI